ncbi:MAG: hypothetical protein WCF79_07805 [Rhodomicrobium sp.]
MSTFLSLRRSAPAKLAFIAILFVAAVVLVRSLSLGSIAGWNPSRSLATSGITSRASGPKRPSFFSAALKIKRAMSNDT